MNTRDENEQRLMGASFVLSRETKKRGIEVLSVHDNSKNEVSAGFIQWIKAVEPAWSFPGGGRSFDANGKLETRSATIQNELEEEINLSLSLELLDSGKVQRYPFLVGQRSKNNINQIGVTSALYWLDQLDLHQETFLSKMEEQGLAKWQKLELLKDEWMSLQAKQNVIESLSSRPHLYTTSYLWFLDLVEKWTNDAILLETNRLNRITHVFIEDESKKLGLSIKNGSFDNSGNILLPKDLSQEDAEFLYGLIE
ncbi:hypothetical protein KA111_02265 [Candidatus Woesebacteria bacterium]|nr:hypothetical protein [Candidatus Woesebacteria bacterium]